MFGLVVYFYTLLLFLNFLSLLSICSLLNLIVSPYVALFFLKKASDSYELQTQQNLNLSLDLCLSLVMLKFNNNNTLTFFSFLVSKYKYYFMSILQKMESSGERRTIWNRHLGNESFLFILLEFQK